MKTRKHLVYAPQYQSDLTVLGSNVQFAPDRGARVLSELAKEFSPNLDLAYRKPQMLTFKQMRRSHYETYLDSLKLPATWAEIFRETSTLQKKGHTT
ncbi:hypothetical protein KA344_06615, partial [bacterium]|nr:hypothetical protein [bacterium]